MKQPVLTALGNDEIFHEEFVAAMSDRSLHLIVLPTEQCNFRCTYCYEDFSIGRMRPEIVQGVKNLLSRRMAELEQLNISWFGGEPLLARTIVEDISSCAVEAVAEAPQVQYSADVTTNGYHLDLATAETWEQLGIRSYQISLDGPEALHDTTRRRANGQGSFQRIWGNLLALRRSRLPKGLPHPTSPARKEACYAARPNSLVIRANGTIAKCTVALSDPSNTIGRITPQGELRIDNGRLAPWVRGWGGSDWAAVSCPYVGMPRSPAPLLQIGSRSPVPS
ncbi:radical SAM protein [Streptomyces fragilis]|uniref:Radical SAM protein n=1 Tax=Streptomyces fragilis TaxID=67301 RepID=A0ABV2YJA1_9ACTN|nr:radical SAM protein [Streptomyces fragilis]